RRVRLMLAHLRRGAPAAQAAELAIAEETARSSRPARALVERAARSARSTASFMTSFVPYARGGRRTPLRRGQPRRVPAPAPEPRRDPRPQRRRPDSARPRRSDGGAVGCVSPRRNTERLVRAVHAGRRARGRRLQRQGARRARPAPVAALL